MKKKTRILIIISIIIILVGAYALQPFINDSFFEERPKGIVHNPTGPPINCCDTTRIMEIKCYRFEHIFRRKHWALNDSGFCLSKGQRICIDHDFKAKIDGKLITARITGVREQNDCPDSHDELCDPSF
jgi:hypothetical protein